MPQTQYQTKPQPVAATPTKGRLRVGTSGYQYAHWREAFYPEALPQRLWLEHYVRHFDTVELNTTFYRLAGEKTFESWRRRAPEGFLYALKFSRFGTHIKRLLDPAGTIGVFMERANQLGKLLGPILVQLPPTMQVDPARLDAFLAEAPRSSRWTVEFRNASWLTDSVYEILSRHHAALCIHDHIDQHPPVITAKWTYLRYHGPGGGGGCYSEQELSQQADRIKEWMDKGIDVYAYFNNDAYGFAVSNAVELRRRLSGAD